MRRILVLATVVASLVLFNGQMATISTATVAHQPPAHTFVHAAGPLYPCNGTPLPC